jgi:hypothetical protein
MNNVINIRSNNYLCQACTVNPMALPKHAPIAIDGNHTPAGTFNPNVNAVKKNFKIEAINSNNVGSQWFS